MHLFGFESDLERMDVLYTSLLIQMWQGLAVTGVPDWTRSPRAWRRSWLLGLISPWSPGCARPKRGPRPDSEATESVGQPSRTDIVLADRKQIIERNLAHAYPVTRKTQLTYSRSGYGAGHSKGQKADIGQRRMCSGTAGALTS
jgi:hypothetical protein